MPCHVVPCRAMPCHAREHEGLPCAHGRGPASSQQEIN